MREYADLDKEWYTVREVVELTGYAEVTLNKMFLDGSALSILRQEGNKTRRYIPRREVEYLIEKRYGMTSSPPHGDRMKKWSERWEAVRKKLLGERRYNEMHEARKEK